MSEVVAQARRVLDANCLTQLHARIFPALLSLELGGFFEQTPGDGELGRRWLRRRDGQGHERDDETRYRVPAELSNPRAEREESHGMWFAEGGRRTRNSRPKARAECSIQARAGVKPSNFSPPARSCERRRTSDPLSGQGPRHTNSGQKNRYRELGRGASPGASRGILSCSPARMTPPFFSRFSRRMMSTPTP